MKIEGDLHTEPSPEAVIRRGPLGFHAKSVALPRMCICHMHWAHLLTGTFGIDNPSALSLAP